MNTRIFLSAAVLAVLTQSAHANPVSRRATLTGVGGNGRCTIEVSVDHTAEVEISGDNGLLTTTAGQPALWRRFQCNVAMPRNPIDFRFIRISGRGTMRMLQDPRHTGGRAVVQIEDPQPGRGNYTFDLEWGGFGGGGGGRWQPGPPAPWQPGPPPPSPGWGPGPGGSPMARSIRNCQDSVTDRLNQDGYPTVSFERTIPDDSTGRNDWISGTVSGKRGYGTTRFSFSCSVDPRSGRVRSVDVQRR